MNQSPNKTRSFPVLGATYMVSAGVVFAAINVLTQWVTGTYHFSSQALAFWQYGLSLVFFVPTLIKLGAGAFRTAHPWADVVRVIFATLGVQFFVGALAAGQAAFTGVGAAFIALGVVFLGKSRQDG